MTRINLIISFLIIFEILLKIQAQSTFTNPIIDFKSADPAIHKHATDGFYYLTVSAEGERQLRIYRSRKLSNFRGAEGAIAYTAREGEDGLWASEMWEVEGQLYIYFSMHRTDHRVYALRADDPSDPMGEWSDPIPIMENWEIGGIDLTVMKHGNGQTYCVWVTNGALWVARMLNGTSCDESHVRLRKDTMPWECCQNEGPYTFQANGVTYLSFSGGDTWDPNYALGLMSIDGEKDPMIPSNWDFGENHSVFSRNDEENVYGPGHNSFTLSPDGTELWLVYHASNTPQINDRIAHIDKINFDENGKPIFPRPSGSGHVQTVPSGEV